jgi:hypothetical protein
MILQRVQLEALSKLPRNPESNLTHCSLPSIRDSMNIDMVRMVFSKLLQDLLLRSLDALLAANKSNFSRILAWLSLGSDDNLTARGTLDLLDELEVTAT